MSEQSLFQQLAGSLEFGAVIGSGRYGKVFRGISKRRQCKVAIKFGLPDQPPAEGKTGTWHDPCWLLLREAAILSELRHPHLPRLMGLYWLEPCGVALTMTYGGYQNLRRLIRQVAVEDFWRWAGQLTGAVAWLHAQGIAHRDIKPANVAVNSAGDATLVDFGLACRLSRGSGVVVRDDLRALFSMQKDPRHAERLAKVGDLDLAAGREKVGTLDFFSPEFLQSHPLSSTIAAMDVWALGVTLYMAASRGEHPFLNREDEVHFDDIKDEGLVHKARIYLDLLPGRQFREVERVGSRGNELLRSMLEKEQRRRVAAFQAHAQLAASASGSPTADHAQ